MNREEAAIIVKRISRLWQTTNSDLLDATLSALQRDSFDYERTLAALEETLLFDSKFFQLSKLRELSGATVSADRISSWIDRQRAIRATQTAAATKALEAEESAIAQATATMSDEDWHALASELAETLPEIERKRLAAGRHPRDIRLIRFAAYDRRKDAR